MFVKVKKKKKTTAMKITFTNSFDDDAVGDNHTSPKYYEHNF